MEQDKVKTPDQNSEGIAMAETAGKEMTQAQGNQDQAGMPDQSSGGIPSAKTTEKATPQGNQEQAGTADQSSGGTPTTETEGKTTPQSNQDTTKAANQSSGEILPAETQGQAKKTGQSLGRTPSTGSAGKKRSQGQDKPKTVGPNSGAQSSDNITQPQGGGELTKTSTANYEKDAGKILEMLEKNNAIVFTGSAGTGKTWLAKQITKLAVSRNGHFYMSLWLSLSLSLKKKQDQGLSLLHSIARQLSVPYVGNSWEDAVFNTDSTNDEKKEVVEDPLKLGRDVADKLKFKYVERKEKEMKEKDETKDTFLLLVLDSEGEVDIRELLPLNNLVDSLLPLASEGSKKNPIAEAFENLQSNIKVLITSTGGEFKSTDEYSILEIKVEPFSDNDAVKFLKQKLENVFPEHHSKFQTLCQAIEVHCRDKSKVLPAQLIMLAEALKRVEKKVPEEQVRAFDAALQLLKVAKTDDAMPLLRFVYETLIDQRLFDFFWHSRKLLGNHGGVQYNELIAHWILEGHLDLADGIKKAYEKGYDIMMELVDLGMLKMQEDNLIVFEGAARTLEDHDCRELFENSNLGLAGLLEGKDSKVFERMAPTDGMMRTVSVDKKGESVSSLLIDGSSLCREDPDSFFKAKQDHLKVLALFDPRMTSLPEPVSKMKNLVLLVLRGCYLLNSVNCIKNLEELVVLEISGSPYLTQMDDDLLEKMIKLKSLNLSALGIKSLPYVSTLKELRRLILRKCRYLEALPKLANLKQIEVIDLSGSSSLARLQEKSFKSFKELRFADFSGTKIEKLPIVQTLPHLSILLVRGCDNLAGLRFMKHLPKLKVLDVSGATRIKEIFYDCFDDTDNLRFLDLSETDIRFLPDSLGKHLCDLKLKGCSKLEKLLSSTGLTDLQSLDLSHSSGLEKFPDDFFVNLTSLQSLDLSNSKVKWFPSLSKLHSLGKLQLKGCSFERLPESKIFGSSKTFGSFEGLTSLVELDLSDCKSQAEQLPGLEGLNLLKVIKLSGYKALSEIGSLEHMSELQELDLSETQISTLPKLSPDPTKLHTIILNKCTKLKEAPDFKIPPQLEELDVRGTNLNGINFEALSSLALLRKLRLSKTAFDRIQSYLDKLKQLEVLDLSGEAVESLPASLASLTNLLQLLLKGCSSLKELPSLNSLSKLEVLDLSGTEVKDIGDKISLLRNIKSLHLPEKLAEEFKDGKNIDALPMELKLDHCCISQPSDKIPQADKKQRIVLQGAEVLKSLKENSKLLESIRHSILSVRAQSKDEDNYSDSRKHIFGDVCSRMRKLLPSEAKDDQSLEIHGFDAFPAGIEVLAEHAKYVFLVENGFMQNLSDLNPDSLKISGCWLERCNNMNTMFLEADQGKWGALEILWISNLPSLESLYEEKVQSLSFGSIKRLYIDCCPKLETVFPSGIPENLETLEITFCDNLKNLVGDKGQDGKEIQTPDSTNDQKVETVDPKGKEPEIKMSTNKKEPSMPAGKETLVRTKSLAPEQGQETSPEDNVKEGKALAASSADEESKGPDGSSSIDESKRDKQVETQAKGPKDPSSVDKETGTNVASSANEVQARTQTTTRTNLKHLHISCCPMLVTVFSSQQVPENLETLRIKRCDKLKSVFLPDSFNPELPNLKTLHLSDLPAWTRSEIGFRYNKSCKRIIKLPKLMEDNTEDLNKQVGHA